MISTTPRQVYGFVNQLIFTLMKLDESHSKPNTVIKEKRKVSAVGIAPKISWLDQQCGLGIHNAWVVFF